MSFLDKLLNMDDGTSSEVNALREEFHKERLIVLGLLEDVEDLIEDISSEIPIHSPKRLEIEQYLPGLRAAISSLRERLNVSHSDGSQRNA